MSTLNWRDRVEQVRAANPLEIVAAQYTQLRRQGHDWVGKCPLHEERTASFTVTPRTQKWFCFGCNQGGDVFKLVQCVEHVTFKEAFARLETQVTATTPRQFIPPPEPPVKVLTAAECRLLTEVVDLYHAALLTERKPLDYLARRQITPAMIKRHSLGYARPGDLLKRFPSSIERARLKALHLLNEEGHEHFRYRIIIPEMRDGEAIYLVGRATLTAQRAKYMGLLDLPKPLYGAGCIQTDEPILLCEGPMDWLTLVEWGYSAVALLGTYLKPNQVAELSRARTVLIVTDSDEPGRHAAARIFEQLGLRACVLPPLPGGVKDVNELAKCPEGRAQFAQLLASVPGGIKVVRSGESLSIALPQPTIRVIA